jgi:hypothetical protein
VGSLYNQVYSLAGILVKAASAAGSALKRTTAANTAAMPIRIARRLTGPRIAHGKPKTGGELIQSITTAMLRLAIADITASIRAALPDEG